MKCFFKVVGSFLLYPVFFLLYILCMLSVFFLLPLMFSGCFKELDPVEWLFNLMDKWMEL